MPEQQRSDFNARQWFVVFQYALDWAGRDLEQDCRDTIERRSRYALLSRKTSPRFARAVSDLGSCLAREAIALRSEKGGV